MSSSYRVFVVHDDVKISRMSQKTFSDFYFAKKPVLKQYAGQRLKLAVAFYRIVDRKPSEILRVDTSQVGVTNKGALDQALALESMLLALDRPWESQPPKAGSSQGVVDATAKFAKRRFDAHHPGLPKAATTESST